MTRYLNRRLGKTVPGTRERGSMKRPLKFQLVLQACLDNFVSFRKIRGNSIRIGNTRWLSYIGRPLTRDQLVYETMIAW